MGRTRKDIEMAGTKRDTIIRSDIDMHGRNKSLVMITLRYWIQIITHFFTSVISFGMGVVMTTVQYILGTGANMDTPDKATGLTERQKNAIRESWQLVSVNLKPNGVNFLIKFFQDYPEDKLFFEAFKDQKPEELRENPKMRAHASTVMHALTSVVENLDDPECLVDLLKKNAQNHYGRSIRVQQYKDLFETFIRFLQDGLGDKCTKLTKESWEKALGVVVAVIEEEMTTLSNGHSK